MKKSLRNIKTIFSVVVLSMFSLGFLLLGTKAEATFGECVSGNMCMFKDVWDSGTSTWVPASINGEAGSQYSFRIGVWNLTGLSSNNVTVSDTLPSGLTYVPGSMVVHGYSGSYTDTNLFAGGVNFGTFANTASIQITYLAQVSGSLAPGSYTLVNSATMTSSRGGGSNTATINATSTGLPSDSGLTGTYYNNKTLSCSPTFSRVDGTVDSTQISWPLTGGPGGGLSDDDFSVSWRGQIKSNNTESITLKTSSDDGIRVFFNGNLVIDKWLDRGVPVTLDTANVSMTAGTWYNIRIDYYEHGGDSIAQLFWNGAAQTGGADQIVPQQNLRQTYTETLNYGLTGEYFNSVNPLGTPVASCIDQSSYFYYDLGSPRSGVNNDNFSVKWTGKIVTDYNETYNFCTKADDGTRLWIDNNIVIDNYTPHTLQEDCGSIALSAGQHNIRLDYFDSVADSAIGLYWQSPSQTSGLKVFVPIDHLIPTGYTGANFGLQADYYSNSGLLGLPTFSRIDPNINFDFGPLSPDGLIPNDNFSIRWTGKITITEAGSYNFVFYSDDGLRFRLNGSLLIDQWVDQTKTRMETGSVVLAPGDYDIQIDYFENTGMGGVFFYYDTPSSPGEVFVPASVLKQ